MAGRITAGELSQTALYITVVAGAAAVLSGDPVYLDVALVLALIAFLGTVAFARYAEQGGHE